MNTPLPGESGEDFAKRQRIVAAAVKPFADNVVPETPHDKIMRRAALCTEYAQQQVREKTANGAIQLAETELYRIIAEAYLATFHSWPKDELVYVCAIMHAQIAMDQRR